MPSSRSSLVLGSRGSALALAQTHEIKQLLRARYPALDIEIKIIKTKGDSFQNLSLSASGGKGLFTREIEQALLRQQIDLAVHSLKDLPVSLPPGLVLAAVPKRADARDVFISKEPLPLANLPAGSRVATSSLRRKAQILLLRSDLIVEEIRGNIETRLQKLFESSSLQALVLAAAGLQRLDVKIKEKILAGKIVPATADKPGPLFAQLFGYDQMLPAIGQGALGLEARAEDERILSFVEAINHYASAQATQAERTFLAELGGGCHVPIGAIAEVREGDLTLRGAVFGVKELQKVAGTVSGKPDDAEAIGKKLAEELIGKGAKKLLETN